MAKKKEDDKDKFQRIKRATCVEISNFLFQLGNQFVGIKNAEAAFDCFRYSLDLNPKHQPSVYNIGTLYLLNNNLEGALRMYSEAHRMRPDDTTTAAALAQVYRKLGRMEDSSKILDRLLKDDPNNPLVLSMVAIMHYDMGNIAQSLRVNSRVLELTPHDLHSRLNDTLIHMTYGEWADYWKHYEFVLSYQKNERMRARKMTEAWAGQPAPGKRLLVISDQGAGDAIQFSRYIEDAKKLGEFSKTIYYVPPDLKDLLIDANVADEVWAFGERQGSTTEYDEFSSLLGIMRVLQVSPENCHREPHIRVNPAHGALWRARLEDDNKFRVGVVWAGDPKHGNDHARSMKLTQMHSRLISHFENRDDIQFYSLQVGAGYEQLAKLDGVIEHKINDIGSEFRDYRDTAAALLQMNLLITVDTSICHLAGCLGVPTWIMISNPPEWRWLLQSGKTPWYSSARLFRQERPQDWEPVLDAVRSELTSKLFS